MAKKALILLVGEQPVPNLLPTRHLGPDAVALIYTHQTKDVAERLKKLFSNCRCISYEITDPYDISKVSRELMAFIKSDLCEYNILFNLTGGTKPMALAAFVVASQCAAPFLYFETERASVLSYYEFQQGDINLIKRETLSEAITLDDYLRAQIGEYEIGEPRNEFERQIYEILCNIPDLEVFTSVRPEKQGALEIDFIVRLENRVGVIEAKTAADKSGIDQIQAVTEQRYLGTYLAKFLVSGKPIDSNNRNLAQAYKIEVIELPNYSKTGTLSEGDRRVLKERIMNGLLPTGLGRSPGAEIPS